MSVGGVASEVSAADELVDVDCPDSSTGAGGKDRGGCDGV